MIKKVICLSFLIAGSYAALGQKMMSEKAIRSVYQSLGSTKNTDSIKYYLVKFSNPSQISGVRIVKKISPEFSVIAASSGIAANPHLKEVTQANSLWKAADNLAQLWQKHPNSRSTIELEVEIRKPISTDMARYGTITVQSGSHIRIKTTLQQLPELLSLPAVVFANQRRQPHEEIVIDDIDLGVNAISAIRNNYPDINGAGINVAVKENRYDDDLDLLGRTFTSFTAAGITSGHATTMATLIGGSGNSFITGLGAAPQVRFTSSDFANLMPDSVGIFKQFNITLQNHSYGTGIENYYGIESAAYDKQVLDVDTLVHVFSSGNVGTSAPETGIYGGLKNFANLSGDFKQAKNVLVVGGTGRNDVPQDLSSSGPAYDGRVKPELVADGEDGTSGAAALVSGAVALLQQAYKQQYHQQPPSALTKSILINAADDIGKAAVDFKTGYGKLNALEAIRTIKDQRFQKGVVTVKQQHDFTITVPPNCRQLKVTLAWNDIPAELNAPEALVNDLDLSVTAPRGSTLLPWVLSTYPSLDSLLAPAQRRRDTINNVEQITLQNPVPGNYTVHVKGSKIPVGQQIFYVAYQAVPANRFEWVYPSGPDQLFAVGENYLHWQNSFDATTGKLSVSYNHGATWQEIGSVNLKNSYYQWHAPDVFTTAKLKMEINGQAQISKEFTLSKPRNLDVGYNCSDGTLLHWNPQLGSTGYVIYNIQENKLQKLATATDTTVLIPVQQQNAPYFAVSAMGNGFEGIKSYTINTANQGVGCYVKSLLALVTGNTVLLNLQVGSVANLKTISWEKMAGADTYLTLGTTTITSNNLAYQFTDTNPKKGTQYYRAKFTTTDNRISYTDLASADYLQPNQFVVYPNPVSTHVNILSGDINDYEFKLYDASGNVRLTTNLTELQNTITLNVNTGVYIYIISLKGKVIHQGKLIKV
ncbi:S8 family peptidase [Mucilaginibacter sp. Bleaf8]|uniref:S8 family peptidase n=1 Tax=Mucilaginibacter sp. Bleaf8 TaxID=2834430 RepID=UPI001BCAB076|nr:S8 family peptidase [Mucilaginibacter sp. Bleaf8]MBS7564427.1 S8 family peptidase [Mucilaginibacter sp. Bleaf8]